MSFGIIFATLANEAEGRRGRQPRPFPIPKRRPFKPIKNLWLLQQNCRQGDVEFPTCERMERPWIFGTSCNDVNEGNFAGIYVCLHTWAST